MPENFLQHYGLNSGLKPFRKALFHLSYSTSPFSERFFEIRFCELFAQAGFEP
jgi:hypothetical protein